MTKFAQSTETIAFFRRHGFSFHSRESAVLHAAQTAASAACTTIGFGENSPQAPVCVRTLEVGETWFSIEEPLFAERLGALLQPGDVLSDAGYVVRTNAQLLARFQIVQPDADGYGLDALHVLPNGVLLFSTDTGFVDARFGWVSDGDLLSENGHIVRRNREIMAPYHPAEDVDNFGLDGLHVLHAVWVGDFNNSGTVDAADQAAFESCLAGPGHPATADCAWADVDTSDSVDLRDFANLQAHQSD